MLLGRNIVVCVVRQCVSCSAPATAADCKCGHYAVTKLCLARFEGGLHAVPEGKLRMRRKAVIALAAHKQEGLQQLKDDPDEMLRGLQKGNPVFLN